MAELRNELGRDRGSGGTSRQIPRASAGLLRGPERQARVYTRRCINECLPGGERALGSGNTIANYVPAANFMAMIDEARR